MAELLSEVEYGRILGSFTAVAEDFGDTVAPDALPLTGTVTFYPSQSHVSYINLAGETASLYIPPTSASIVNGRIIGSDGKDGVVLLASNSNNVSASVLWTARISINPINSGDPAPADHDFLIEVRRGEIASLIDVIKATSRVHNIALFNDAIAEAAAAFWERVESGEFRGNQGPPGPAGVGVGVPGPLGRPGIMGKDGDPGVGGNLIPDGDLEEPGFLVSGDYQESSDAVSGSKAVRLSNATSRRIRLEPDTSYVGTVYLKSDEATAVNISQRVFGSEGDIDRVIEDSYQIPANTWQRVTFLLDSNVGDQSMEIIVTTDGRTISADLFALSDNSVVKGLQRDLTAAKAQLEAAMAQLDIDLAGVDADKEMLAVSLNDLAVVLEDADVDLTELNTEMEDLKNDLVAEETKRQDADAAAQVILGQLDTNLAQAKQDLVDNKIILETLDTDLATAKAELLESAQSIETLETVTLPELRSTLEAANTAAIQELAALDDKLYGAEGDITTAKASIAQLASDLTTEAQTRAQLAIDLQADFEERDTRLAEAEGILSAAFPDGAVNVPEELSRTIRDSVVQYAVSDSAETPPTTGWSPAAPTKDPGQYIWFRTLITYGDNSTSPSSAALLTGNTGPGGPQGPAGEDGTDGTGVTILGSRDSEAQLPTTGNEGDAYLVGGYLYVWSSGSWSNVGLIRGPQGVPGPAGEDGEPRFTWVKYASSATGTGISDDPAGKAYIGLAYNKPTAVESDTPGDYQWALIQGPQGSPGIQGPAGEDGTSLYTWLKYASTPTTGMSDSPIGKDYIGLAYNRTTPTESDTYTDYQWTLIKGAKGDQGVPGDPGADGTPRYTWVKYATSGTGAGMTDDPTGMTYIGLAYNKTSATESSVAGDYQWALIQGPRGEAGPQGVPGPEGADGESLYTWIKYATTPTTGMADLPAGKKYMGIAYNKPTATESSSYSDYEWSLIEGPQGNQGIQGPKGVDGQTTYTWIKYGTSASGAGISDSPTGKTYIGIAYNKTTATESGTASDYQWSLIQGPQGATGGTGPQGIGISSITPYYRDVVRGAAAPAVPTTATPSGWATSEPTWVANRDLYRVEKITYTNSTFAYTAVTKIAAYAGIDAAMAAASGKNLNTYTDLAPASKPGPAPAPNSARTSGDVHRNRDSSTGEIWAEYQWTGSAWKEVSYGDEILRSLDVGKVTGGTGAFQKFFADKLIADDATINKLWADQISAKTAAFNRLTVAPTNLIPDPNNTDPDIRAWRSISGSGPTWNADEGYWSLTPPAAYNTIRMEGSSNTRTISSDIVPGQRYVLSFDVWMDAGTSSGARFAPAYLKTDGSTGYVGDDTEPGGDISGYTGFPTGQWTTITRYWDAPSDAVSASFDLQVNGVSGAGELRIKNPVVRPAVGAVLIENGAVSADKINAESVAGAVGSFIELETSQLVATDSIKTPEAVIDKIWADGIAARSVTAGSVTVAPGNLLSWPTHRRGVDSFNIHPHRMYGSGAADIRWSWDAVTGDMLDVTMVSGTAGFFMQLFSELESSVVSSYGNRPFPAKGGNDYRLEMSLGAGGSYPDGHPKLSATFYWYGHDGTIISTSGGDIVNADGDQRMLYANLERSGVTVRAPDNAAYVHVFLSTSGASGHVYIVEPELLPLVGAVQISDGAVNASKINAESVGAAVGEFVKLDVKNLTASSANIDSLVAQRIAAGTAAFQTVNANKIVSSTGVMDSAVINQIWADGIAAKSATFSKVTVATSNLLPELDAAVSAQSTGELGYWTNFGINTSDPAFWVAGDDSVSRFLEYEFYVKEGTRYAFTVDVRTSKAGAVFSWELVGPGGTNIPLSSPDGGATTSYPLYRVATTGTGYETFQSSAVVTMSAVARLRIFPNHSSGVSNSGGYMWFRNASIRPQVGAVLIENGAISANHITADSIDTDHLRTNAVSAAKIVAGAITTAKMTANSINGDRISANSLQANKIAANTITATQIKARAISAAEIATRTLLAENIVAGTITGNEIKARTIKAAEIASGTITANEVNVDNLWANGISAKTISTARLTVSSGNAYWNPDFADSAGHGSYWEAGGGKNGGNSVVIPAGTGQKGSYDLASSRYSERTIVSPGQAYAIGAWVRLSAYSAASANNISLYARLYSEASNGASFGTILSVKPSFAFSSGTWYWVEDVVTIPEDYTRLAIGFYTESGFTGAARFSNPSVRIATTSTTIEGGAIKTGHMTANSIDGDRIQADSLNANRIIAGTITTNHMTAGTIDGDRIKANTLSADKIKGDTFEGNTFTGGQFNGSSFIGGSYATTSRPSSDGGVMIDPTNGLRTWNSSGKMTVQISPSNGQIMLSDYLKAVNSSGRGVMLIPTTSTGGGGLWFSHTGGGGATDAAIYRSGYDTNAREPIWLRGANGAGINVAGGIRAYDSAVEGDLGGMFYGNGVSTNRFVHINPPTTSAGANALIASSPAGVLYKSTSSRRYKKNIADWNPAKERVLALQPRQWQHDDPNHPDDIDETWHSGFIAEEVHDLGLKLLVKYTGDGKGGWIPDGLNYDRFATAHQIVLKDHEARVESLEKMVEDLMSEIKTLRNEL